MAGMSLKGTEEGMKSEEGVFPHIFPLVAN